MSPQPLQELKVPSTVGKDWSYYVVGKRGTGKSWFMRWFFMQASPELQTRETFVFTNTAFNDWYQQWVPRPFVYQGVQEDVLRALLYRQYKRVSRWRRRVRYNKAKGVPPPEIPEGQHITIGMDDVVDTRVRDTARSVLDTILLNGRHYWISFFLLSQVPVGLSPTQRSNIDMVVLMRQTNAVHIKRLYEDFAAGYFPAGIHGFRIFHRVLDEATRDNGFLSIITRNRLDDGTPIDTVFDAFRTGKASEPPPEWEGIGSPEQRAIGDEDGERFIEVMENRYSERQRIEAGGGLPSSEGDDDDIADVTTALDTMMMDTEEGREEEEEDDDEDAEPPPSIPGMAGAP